MHIIVQKIFLSESSTGPREIKHLSDCGLRLFPLIQCGQGGDLPIFRDSDASDALVIISRPADISPVALECLDKCASEPTCGQ